MKHRPLTRTSVSLLHATLATVSLSSPGTAGPSHAWPMRGGDMHNTNRASFIVPPERQNSTLFGFVIWQAPKPGGPSHGETSGGQMVYSDGTPAGDVVAGGYHWPKGVMGLDRHTGAVLWFGNPAGGESIGANTPAFSPDGATVYVTNDATPGHPLMAFPTLLGPSAFYSNSGHNDPESGSWSPFLLPSGNVVVSNWCEFVAGFDDTGTSLARAWTASGTCSCYPTAAAYEDLGLTRVFTASRCGFVTCFDAATGAQVWQTPVGLPTDAGVTVDPNTGDLYVPLGEGSIAIASLDRLGTPRWDGATPLFTHEPGVNEPQRAQSAGALSHDGATFYFQTVARDGSGMLHAIDTADGGVRWSYPTGSAGWEAVSSSPIVTPNGLLIVGNNDGGAYLALRDDGSSATLLDTFVNTADGPGLGRASCSATLAHDGALYLPVRTAWTYPHAGGDAPTGEVRHLFAAFDLTEDPSVSLPHPAGTAAFAGDASVRLIWTPITASPDVFEHYAVYRDAEPFGSLTGRTPIATVPGLASETYTDTTATNGVGYHYAVASVPTAGDPADGIASVGPRTPFRESDLQIVSIRRTPEYPRYAATYTYYSITDPDGYGPYVFSAATGLGEGQTAGTQRWPETGDTVTYTAAVRNRGTVPMPGPHTLRWLVDGDAVGTTNIPQALSPGETVTVGLEQTWDGELHTIACELLGADDRGSNNALAVGSKSVAFLSYIDETRIEEFREETASYPAAITDDKIDWLNAHVARFNQMFEDAGTDKRVHFAVLGVIGDEDPDPDVPRINYAIFPFRYRAGEGSLRLSGYYRPQEDLDHGLLHEMGHQLGLIDIYQLDLPSDRNHVSGQGYTAVDCLMRGVSPFLSVHSANAMQHWLDEAHGYYGQYLYSMPEQIRLRVLGVDGEPLTGAAVRVYQKNEVPGLGQVITDQVKHEGTTDDDGFYTLPNVPIDTQLAPPVFTGDTLAPNPFGYVAVVGSNGLLLIEIEEGGFTDHAWLDITEVNNAYWAGQTALATFERRVSIGGPVLEYLPPDLAEHNAQNWFPSADGATAEMFDDESHRVYGWASVRFETTGGFDTSARFPRGPARLDLTNTTHMRFFAYAENPNIGFQGDVPWIRLVAAGGSVDLRPNGAVLNQANDRWHEFVVPLAGDADWARSEIGSPDLGETHALEIHADTWDSGFTLWLDGVRFTPHPCPADLAPPFGLLDLADVISFVGWFQAGDPIVDLDASGLIDLSDITAFVTGFLGGCG
jgi:hypothetical protein